MEVVMNWIFTATRTVHVLYCIVLYTLFLENNNIPTNLRNTIHRTTQHYQTKIYKYKTRKATAGTLLGLQCNSTKLSCCDTHHALPAVCNYTYTYIHTLINYGTGPTAYKLQYSAYSKQNININIYRII